MPIVPLILLCLTYSLLTLLSFRGCGVKMALIVVTIGPFIPQTTITSPTLNSPLNNITSIVTPKPCVNEFLYLYILNLHQVTTEC